MPGRAGVSLSSLTLLTLPRAQLSAFWKAPEFLTEGQVSLGSGVSELHPPSFSPVQARPRSTRLSDRLFLP